MNPDQTTPPDTDAEAAPDSPAAVERLPEPVQSQRPPLSLWLIWLVPLVAVAVGIGLGVHALSARGPSITIEFRTGEGLEAGKTHIKLKDVDVGVVRAVRLSEDLAAVEVVAELQPGPSAALLMRRDTRFWVVRPRVGAGGVSGLGTLLSGAYIGVDAGRDSESAHAFKGLDQQPAIAADVPGRRFRLLADELGSLDVGSPVFFRRVPVGQVSGYALDPDGHGVAFTVFVQAPYDRFVTARSRFWHASGVNLNIDAQGARIETQSLASLLAGGIAFSDVPDEELRHVQAPGPAGEGSEFRLYGRESDAMKRPDGPGFDYRLLLQSSVRGLLVGAPVEYRGLLIGEVTKIAVQGAIARRSPDPSIAVDIRVYPSRLPTVEGDRISDSAKAQRARLDPMVAHGLRAQLRAGNLLTGQLYVALDYFPNVPPAQVDWSVQPPRFPTTPGSLEALQETLASLVHKLDALPLDTLAQDLHRDLDTLNTTLVRADTVMQHLDADLRPEARRLLEDARGSVKDLQKLMGTADQTLAGPGTQALGEMQRAARSLRQLADYLEQHPESLVRGKPEDPK